MKIIKLKKYGKIFLVLFCTIIGGYGIFTAPESDKKTLEQELIQNQQILQQVNSVAQAKTKPIEDTEPQSIKKGSQKAKKKTVSVIGDSIFLGAAPSFQKIQKNTFIDAKISRQVYQGIDVAKKMKKKGKLGNIVIISLGTNGKFNESTGQKLINCLGKKRTVYWINVYGKNISWQKEVNSTIQKLAAKNSNVHVIPWTKEAKKHPGWFYQDGTHLNPKGQDGFSRFVKKQIQ
ncbi:hypothetical protein D7V86_02345 [bacterium D16-51]|nr:hypothetical protein D7V96_01770 [bacterium D16-59]RKI62379.1 hypothetical protein D7V86_02345 [bacterium D16-51]